MLTKPKNRNVKISEDHESPDIYLYGCACNSTHSDDSDMMLTMIHYSLYEKAYEDFFAEAEVFAEDIDTLISLQESESFESEVLMMQRQKLV